MSKKHQQPKQIRYLCFIGIIAVAIIGTIGSNGDGAKTEQVTYTNVPIQLSIENVELSAGVPATFTYTIPVTGGPYTTITIDLDSTLETTNLDLTPAP